MVSTEKPELCNFYFSSQIIKLMLCYFIVVILSYVIWSLCVNRRTMGKS